MLSLCWSAALRDPLEVGLEDAVQLGDREAVVAGASYSFCSKSPPLVAYEANTTLAPRKAMASTRRP